MNYRPLWQGFSRLLTALVDLDDFVQEPALRQPAVHFRNVTSLSYSRSSQNLLLSRLNGPVIFIKWMLCIAVARSSGACDIT
jgi:hypothetical protein